MGRAQFAASVGLALSCVAGLVAHAQAAEACPNEAARTGPSASLPDCRAYEQVTPADKSSTVQDMDPSSTLALAAADGNSIALYGPATFGPTPQLGDSFSVLSRTASGWVIQSVKPADSGSTSYDFQIFSPDLTQLGVKSETQYPFTSNLTFQIGVPGGSLATVAATPREDLNEHHKGDQLLGASPDFSHVVFGSVDHTLLSPTPTGTDEEAYDLYEWSGSGECSSVGSSCKLVNVSNDGSVIGECGASLGRGFTGPSVPSLGSFFTQNAVSAGGSRVFFTAPDPEGGGEGCSVAPRIYMRVTEVIGGREESKTVEVGGPPEVELKAGEEEMPELYQVTSARGSKVFFITERALTSGATPKDEHLYEYNAEAPEGERLTLIFQGTQIPGETVERSVFPSEDGSVVYFYRNNYTTLYRYEAAGGGTLRQIASMSTPSQTDEPPYTSPDGEFFLFESFEVAGEPRGEGHNEIYRYDRANESVMCVSCGPGKAPASGTASLSDDHRPVFAPIDQTPEPIPMSNDGSEVFFDSSAALVPQVVNEGKTPEGNPVINVYEWEADGAGACMQSLGCTHLISQGNDQRESLLIGASADGSNVFFMTHAQLVPQDKDNSADIYDARVDGGFSVPPESVACLGDTCQSVPPALTDPTPAWSSFTGPVNPRPLLGPAKPKPKAKGCGKGKVRKKGRCVKQRRARKSGHRVVGHDDGGSR